MSGRITVVQGDITRIDTDVIVNAANPSLMGGGGVDGAIHRAAGPALLAACKVVRQQQGECQPGHAVITEAGDLPVKAVVHTVGPVWRGGQDNEPQLLADAYRNSLALVTANGYSCVAFPAISTGVYGYPKAAAAQIAFETVSDYLTRRPQLQQVYFVCYDEENFLLYQRLLGQYNEQPGA
ncbi:COG2110, Macro domain, possibly ADP-ribose binding module [Cronobacter condimenti 1330]|uniref:O-acetyl-ADP-ribose deacetylase n=1 Tax=Cronobacter condimenti 1330 TaxID=1073999 RepID=K7ZY35_9ENTR|nr:O-acetyl-ADP-ribose deacetylase [Cronobacter condimenti]ALB62371.1 RNase III inhibitor [Cronobacter condimenti 1330]CCJ71393.1 COG2110, Macro domain, possibly ADP-ribose binding module [Cronobacter condimenti 1330]